ncbi:uncharacterized protein LOC130785793 [Actinidia eriantha]|uniref:uncharacterized protein LOC130785793 n=1 Tax=Actinidia eriantha TaxID=165200 RepID=UPI0025868E6D|nr:uncharacterized protein LOC130785793 [Actinidia eriantha]
MDLKKFKPTMRKAKRRRGQLMCLQSALLSQLYFRSLFLPVLIPKSQSKMLRIHVVHGVLALLLDLAIFLSALFLLPPFLHYEDHTNLHYQFRDLLFGGNQWRRRVPLVEPPRPPSGGPT